MKPKNLPPPVLRSLPVHETLDIPPRAQLLPKIESGEIDHLDFNARVYGTGKNRNPYIFKDEDLETFAASFEGQPFLRNHDTTDIDARDGTIIDAALEGQMFRQTIRLTTRRGMMDFIEGKIDRFSIGWFYDDITCSICNNSFFSRDCSHWPGQKYKVTESREETCMLIFINPRGKETSAVNTPAVEGTGIDALQEYKLELIGEVTAVSHPGTTRSNAARSASNPKFMKGDKYMKKKVTNPAALEAEADLEDVQAEERSEEMRAALELQGANHIIAELQDRQALAHQMLVEQCRSLLETSLQASRLPAASQAAIRKPFERRLNEGEPFTASELQEAITDKRNELAEISAANTIQGPARSVYGVYNSTDQFRLAVEDLFGVDRAPAEAGIKVHRLRGIQEAYLMATGDVQFMGGFWPEYSLVTANFPGIVANVMNKILVQAWKDFEQVYGWWQKIVTVEHFTNLNQVSWVKTGTISSLPTVAERGEYTELNIGDNRETTDWSKYGGYIPITIEAMLRDDIGALKRMPREAALAGIRNISEQVAAIFTQNAAAGPTLADTGALFNSTAVTTAGGHANLLTTALGTDFTAWDAVAAAVYGQPLLVKNATGIYGTGKPQAIEPRFCLVPRELKANAEALFIPRWAGTIEAAIAARGGPTYGGFVEPLTVPEWTDATDWAAAVDPKLVPGIMIGEIFGVMPQVFVAGSEIDPAMFANDESRIKVRQFLAVGVADYRPLHKSNVA